MASNEKEEAPFHVLMASSRPTQELLVRNDALQKDYLARRYKALNEGKMEINIWSAVLPVERAMIECCELGVEEEQQEAVIGGCLKMGKERDFVRILALHCHTAATRALALATLERTIGQDELETEEHGEIEESVTDDTDALDIYISGAVNKSEDNAESEPQQQKSKESKQDSNENVTDVGRMGHFLEAGGLKILKQWLIDAMTPCKTVVTKPATAQQQAAGNNKKKEAPIRVIQTVPSPTGPLLLPLLAILTEMPFDKDLVMSVKINKLIRKLRKQLDEAIASRRNKRADDKQWTDPVAGGLVVNQVQTAVASLMTKWEKKSKTTSFSTQDPFATFQREMKKRLELLNKYELDESEKPQFLQDFEEEERLAKEAEVVSKLTTEQRAARERQQEREQMLKIVQQKQSEAKAKMELLLKKTREESKKRMAEGKALGGDSKRTRRVRWKDGLQNADNIRQRKLLEQVHVYIKESDYDGEDGLSVKQEEEAVIKQNPACSLS